MNNKKLVLLVDSYPFNKGEPFLETELKVLESKFKDIYIIQTGKITDENTSRYLPNNVTTINLNDFDILKPQMRAINISNLSFVLVELFRAVFKHHQLPTLGLLRVINYYFKKSRYDAFLLKKVIEKYQFSMENTLFYSYWCDTYTLALACLSKELSIKFVTRLHGWDMYFERHKPAFLPFREFIASRSVKLIPIADDGQNYLISKQLVSTLDKIQVSRLGVEDLQVNRNYRDDRLQDVDSLKIVTLSRVVSVKRLDRLIDALSQVDNINVSWTHIGDGEEVNYRNIEKMANDRLSSKGNIDYSFKGYFSQQEVKSYLQENPIDFIVNCSESEGVPVSLMESLSAGIPVIAFDVGGIRELIEHEVNGFLLPNKEKEHITLLKNSIIKFANLSNEEKEKMSINAKTVWKRKYNAIHNYEEFSQVLTDIVSS